MNKQVTFLLQKRKNIFGRANAKMHNNYLPVGHANVKGCCER